MSAHGELVLCLCELTTLLWSLLLPLVFLCVLLTGVAVLLVAGVRAWLRVNRNVRRARDGGPTVGFFHPYCTAGGGGERVLWSALRALQDRYPDVSLVVYTGDLGVSGRQILEGARRRFDVQLPRPVEFVFLRQRWLLEMFPHLPLLGQSVGSVLLGCEALVKLVPDLYVDSAGYAFTLPLFRYLGGCRVASYVHHPAVSIDQLSAVPERNPRFNNTDYISSGLFLGAVKALSYCLFALLYGLAGSCSHAIMVNSTSTLEHILALWRSPDRTRLVYPPCDVAAFLDAPLVDRGDRKCRSIVSVGQFRAEKDHELQIRAFRELLERRGGAGLGGLRLVLIGGCRNQEDEDRVLMLRGRCVEMGVADRVAFKVNVPFEELKRELAEATVALHTMRNQHFGIGVVECMAAGAVTVAHKSGGPQRDIMVPYEGGRMGFLADGEDDYADAMETALALAPLARLDLIRNARRSVARFSDREFEAGFLAATDPLMEALLP